jgi:hypothetical protein
MDYKDTKKIVDDLQKAMSVLVKSSLTTRKLVTVDELEAIGAERLKDYIQNQTANEIVRYALRNQRLPVKQSGNEFRTTAYVLTEDEGVMLARALDEALYVLQALKAPGPA